LRRRVSIKAFTVNPRLGLRRSPLAHEP
jgi:hypothetical protein